MQILVQVRTKPEDFYAVVSPARDFSPDICASSNLDLTNINPPSLLLTFAAA